MKIQGKEDLKYKIPLKLFFGKEAIFLEVNALPINFRNRLVEKFPVISPPIKGFAKDKKGNLIKDEHGKFVPLYDFYDPKFQAKEAQLDTHQMVYTVYEALKGSPEVVFNNKEEDFDDPVEFVEAIEKELIDIGFTQNQLEAVAQTLSGGSGLEGIDQEKKS